MPNARRESKSGGNPRAKSVWAPLLLRGLATGIALAGLAGIGVAASRSPELAPLEIPGARLASLASAPLGLSPGGARSGGGSSRSVSPDAGAVPVADACPCAAASPPPCAAAKPPHAAGEAAAARRVILNRATASELQRLPGIGARRADQIIELRQRLGGFRRVGDLLRIKGIGPRMLERLLPHLVLDAEEPPVSPAKPAASP